VSGRTRLAPLAAAVLALAMVSPAAAAVATPRAIQSATMTSAIDVPASWGPQALGWGDLIWFSASTRSASCLAIRRDGWTLLANLPWLHDLVVAAPHASGSVAAVARADLLDKWWHFAHDARSFIKAGNQCPSTLAGRQKAAGTIVGNLGGDTTPGWAHRMFELFAVLYPQTLDSSCTALQKNVASAQEDLAKGVTHAKYFGRAAMTTNPARWLDLLKTGATCIVSQGGGMEAGVGFGLPALLGSARAEHFHDLPAAKRLRKFFGS
jgi:hypothetical protein